MNMNEILEREHISIEIKEILNDFQANCRNISYKKGIYIYGSPGAGKTYFIMNILKELNYDAIKYDAGDVRNKTLIDTITCNNISSKNVLYMMNRKVKNIAIVMDEIDGMNNGDKGGITSLIKLIRQKKTKKQKLENVTLNPIICIGNYNVDKKIKELMKVCNVFELKPITSLQIEKLLHYKDITPNIEKKSTNETIVKYIQGDLRKLHFIEKIMKNKPELLLNDTVLEKFFHLKSHNDDSKKITKSIMNNYISLQNHGQFMNETERTIVALLYHENIIDPLFSDLTLDTNSTNKYTFYTKILENICFADHTDRVTFQNQIWIFNEMSSLIKTFSNNYLYHTKFPELTNSFNPSEVRFTKVLTKYSTEYNNQLFIYFLCQELDMDKKDMISLFQELRLMYKKNSKNFMSDIEEIFQDTNITILDIKRIYRFIDKNVKSDEIDEIDDE
jgi:DNA polymerase III delta prime subunit